MLKEIQSRLFDLGAAVATPVQTSSIKKKAFTEVNAHSKYCQLLSPTCLSERGLRPIDKCMIIQDIVTYCINQFTDYTSHGYCIFLFTSPDRKKAFS